MKRVKMKNEKAENFEDERTYPDGKRIEMKRRV